MDTAYSIYYTVTVNEIFFSFIIYSKWLLLAQKAMIDFVFIFSSPSSWQNFLMGSLSLPPTLILSPWPGWMKAERGECRSLFFLGVCTDLLYERQWLGNVLI